VTLVVMVPEKEGDTPTTTPDVEMLGEIADPDPTETEKLGEIPVAPLAEALGEIAVATDALGDTAALVETVSVILAEPDTEHIRRTRVLAWSEATTVATPDGFWAAVTTSTSEGLRAFWPTVDAPHVPKAAELGKKMPDAADAPVVAAVPEK
jgi:hypothetical protein